MRVKYSLYGQIARALSDRSAYTFIVGNAGLRFASGVPNRSGNRYTGGFDHQQLQATHAATYLEYMCGLDIHSPPSHTCLSGIVCTIGPACRDPETIKDMIRAGMSVARLNFSHGSHTYHAESIAMIRESADKLHRSVAIALDTKGPEIRTGIMRLGVNSEATLVRGSDVIVTVDDEYKEKCDEKTLWINYKNIVNILGVGSVISMADGLVTLVCTDKGSNWLKCRVEAGGVIGSRKGCNLPGATVDLPAVSERDKEDLEFAVNHDIDFVFASFIRSGEAIRTIRGILGDTGKFIKIIAKIENDQGIRNFDEILDASDGVMVARGDMGTEISLEKVFLAQKMLIGRCNRAGKPVICATQMLESMCYNPQPTRAEASDVANAILDGADSVMLSGETAKGKYPVAAVQIMSKIVREAESAVYHRQLTEELRCVTPVPTDIRTTSAIAAVQASNDTMASAIIVMTSLGGSAARIAAYRPRCPIVAVTSYPQVARQLNLYRGIVGCHYTGASLDDWAEDTDERISYALKVGVTKKFITAGSKVVVLTGWREGSSFSNTIQIFEVSGEISEAGHLQFYHSDNPQKRPRILQQMEAALKESTRTIYK